MELSELEALGAYSVSGTLFLNGVSIAKSFTADEIVLTAEGTALVAELQAAAATPKKTRKKAADAELPQAE